jgi:sugar lactone lactonase YvrE
MSADLSDEIVAAMEAAIHPPEAQGTSLLRVVAETRTMVWNAVAIDNGRVFVAGPRWTGGRPPLARLNARGQTVAYPDESWNGWHEGLPGRGAFVNVNALHHDSKGHLWVIDSGTPVFGAVPVSGGAKVVCIDLATDRVASVFPFASDIARAGSYVDDMRIHNDRAYLTDAGRPGIIVLDLTTGISRRVLDDHPATTAPADRPIVVAGDTLLAPDGTPLRVHSDPLELSPDGQWFYFGPLEGPWSKIETRFLNDPSLSTEELGACVMPWADLPPIGGAVMDAAGNLYFTDLADSSLKRRDADGTISTIVTDPNLHWVDAPFIDEFGAIWLPVPQLDRVALFHGSKSEIQWPVRLYHMQLPDSPYED